MTAADAAPALGPKDFATDQEVRWCPGCGDYAILGAVRKALAESGVRKEDVVFVSGIGCAARFPYYVDTYGMHGIHGRAPALATGVKLANPDLQVWVLSGDGDLLSIGGNHTLHALRRNIDINVVLHNNRIYGLTKGQYSPTSERGKVTKSTPMGSLDHPINPLCLAIAAGATFVSRCLDVDVKMLAPLLVRAAAHKGASFVEVMQNCTVFNHGTWEHAADKKTRADSTVHLEHGKPMVFGANEDRAITSTPEGLRVIGVDEGDALVHDETDSGRAYLLAQMAPPEFPEPVGVLYRCEEKPTYDTLLVEQMQAAVEERGPGDFAQHVRDAETWVVEAAGKSEVVVSEDPDA